MKRHPRRVRFDPRLNPVRLAMQLSDSDRRQIEARERLALSEIEAGTGGVQSRRELLYAASLSGTLALRDIGPEAHHQAVAALNTLGEDAPDVECLRTMLDTLDGQRRMATRGELLAAMLTARDVVRLLQPAG